MEKLKIKWWQKSVAYQVYPKSFQDSDHDGIGDLKGIISRLGYLEELGIDLLWIGPVYCSPMKDNGYDISDYYKIDPQFGTNEDMYRLIEEAERHGIRVIMDMVLNHCSSQHEWFQKALTDPEGEYGQYFYFRKGKGGNPPNNWRSIFGGSAWEKVEGSPYYYLHLFTKDQADLNWENPKLRRELYQIINFWLDKGIAGFRFDAITYIKKEAGLPSYPPDADDGMVSVKPGALARPGIEQFLRELKEETYGKRDCFTVGETEGLTGDRRRSFISLKDGLFSSVFDTSHLNLDLYPPNYFWCERKKWTPDELRDLLLNSQISVLPDGWLSTFLECHDMPRCIDYLLPEEGRTYYGASMLAALYLFLRGTPFIYQGQELGMRNFPFPDIETYDDCSSKSEYAYALSKGCSEKEALSYIQQRSRDNGRYPFSWDESEYAGFSDTRPWLPVSPDHKTVNAKRELNDPHSLFHFYQRLIALRKSEAYGEVLCLGTIEKAYTGYENLFAYKRSFRDRTICVLCNNQNKPCTIALDPGGEVLVSNYENCGTDVCGTFELQPFQCLVLSEAKADDKTKERLQKLSLREKCALLSGESFNRTKSAQQAGIRSLLLTDGPHGVRLQPEKADHLGINGSLPATCFPTACALGASWDEDLLFRMGQALGEECRAFGVDVILGPGANIKRSPLCGRNFEYFSEDPFLSSHLAAGHIKGVQSTGTGACLKHFAANNQETHRLTLDAVVDERTLREIYLASFEYAVKEAKPWTVMAAYNRLNGEYGSENFYLLNDILRADWGYEGLVVSDWGGTNDRVKGLMAGLDLEMPSSGEVNDKKLEKAVEDGTLPLSLVDQSVGRLMALQDKIAPNADPELFHPEKHHRLAREIAADCIVLLKNEDSILPLGRKEYIGVVGEFAVNPRYQGGGSSHIEPTMLDTLLDKMTEIGGDHVSYAKGFTANEDASDPQLFQEALELAGTVDKLVICAGLPEKYETEGEDRRHLSLPASQLKLIHQLAQVNPETIVVLSNGAPVEMPFANEVKGIVEGYLLGQAGGGAMADILYGLKNPSGKLAESFPLRLEDTPCYLNFPGEGNRVAYREGVFVGYRYYDTKKIPTLFCFGHGLSYTSFEYSDIRLTSLTASGEEEILHGKVTDQDTVIVRAVITNTGNCFGKEVVQLYVADHQERIRRPAKELKGFCKLSLKPQESREAEFQLDGRSFACYNEEQHEFQVQSGSFTVMIGASLEDIRLAQEITVCSTAVSKREFQRTSSFGDVYDYEPTRKIALQLISYFERESGIDFNLGERTEDFAFKNICDFPLKSLVTFTQGRFSEEKLDALLLRLNKIGAAGRETKT